VAPLNYLYMKSQTKPLDPALTVRLASRGFRFTSQREHVYKVLLQDRDHPTAERVFMRAKKTMPEISLATVYNCLDALVKCRLAKEVNLDRGASRYCPNMREHFHFYCTQCDEVIDINLPLDATEPPFPLPKGFKPTHFDISVRGVCPKCGTSPQPSSDPSSHEQRH